MTRAAPSIRIDWAITQLRARATDWVLEIGCGKGDAAALLLPKLTRGHLHALDRSPTAVAACRKRLAEGLAAGRAEVSCSELADLGPVERRFDRAFAINVNVFWLDPSAELPRVRRALRAGGALLLVYEPPSAVKLAGIARACASPLKEHGFSHVSVVRAPAAMGPLVAIRARSSID